MELSHTRPDSDQNSPRTFSVLEKPAIFWALVLLVLTFMGAVMLHTARIENTTFDEATYITAGYDYFVRGDYWFNVEHPPLAKLIAAAPLVPHDLKLPTDHPAYRRRHIHDGPVQFLYRNRMPPAEILLLARLPFICLTLLFGAFLAAWTRRHFGAIAALIALFLYALDPTIISHGHYAATDFLTGVFFFLACAAWLWFLRTESWGAILLSGVVLGLALATKFSGLLLVGILPVLYGIHWCQSPGRCSVRRGAMSLAAVFAIGIGTVALLYYPETKRTFQSGQPALSELVDNSTATGRFFNWLDDTFDVAGHAYMVGIARQAQHNKDGHRAYLLGESSDDGWWYYFPLVFLLKTPLALQLGLLSSLLLALFHWRRESLPRLRQIPLHWLVLVLVPLIFLTVVVNARINLGQRYLLPLYPFLYVLAGAALARFRAWRLTAALLLLLCVEHATIAPHYLAYFNPLVGGAAHGPKYLVDSNIDWGQDLNKLVNYLEERRIPRVCAAYFGTADTDYHVLNFDMPPSTGDVERDGEPGCVATVSATYLYGADNDPYGWLREKEPTARIGYSIYVYDLRPPADAQ
jgi:4-amino-4-deoxy-L-arabinose transferase-like glycosyltransferase